jgi:A/G-specific adenine glycosylase
MAQDQWTRISMAQKKSSSNYIRIISEILLQRTKAETVNKYLPIFLKKYPSWAQLGNATEMELIEILRPLGLSSQRGKRLHKLSQELKKRNGIFPKERSLVKGDADDGSVYYKCF